MDTIGTDGSDGDQQSAGEGTDPTLGGASSEVSPRKPHHGKYQHEIEHMYEHQGVLYLPSTPLDYLEKIPDMALSPADTLISTFSKSGTTWTQEVCYLIQNGVDVEEARTRPVTQRVPFLDYLPMYYVLTAREPPRLIKTHLQAHFFRKHIEQTKVKVVMMMRNPKDTLVSFYHFYKVNKAFGCYQGSWDDFFELIRHKQLIYGDWFDYTLGWWAMRHHPNVLILKYEDMKVDPAGNIAKLGQFMGKNLSPEEVSKIVEATSFDSMKANPSVSYQGRDDFLTKGTTFMRKGSIGDWKNYFTASQNAYFDALYEEKMAGTGLDFIFDM